MATVETSTSLAYTDWADIFVPTVVRWRYSDEIDDLKDSEGAMANARGALKGEAIEER